MALEKMEQLKQEFIKFQQWGYSTQESAIKSIDEVFKDLPIKPYLYLDSYEDASYVSYKEFIFMFDDKGIYKRV